MSEKLLLHINGKDQPSRDGATFEVRNPTTNALLFEVANATQEDVNEAIEVAREAFNDRRWWGMRPRDRARILNRAAATLADRIDEFASLESSQTGRTLREMRSQLRRLPEWLEYFGALSQTIEGASPDFGSGHVNVVQRVPLGVAGLITPWNHPLLISMKKISVALAAGNSIVLKPSELAPVVPHALVKLLEEAGVPEGVVNVITGLGSTTGRFLSEHVGLDKLDLTGGTGTGRVVAANAGRSLIPMTAELGGKAPVIIFDDCDVERAVAGALFASFIATGQTCVQGSRILIQEGIYDKVVNRLVERCANLHLGDPMDLNTQVGPLISRNQRQKVEDAVDLARAEGANVICGGQAPTGTEFENGWFYQPTIVADVTSRHTLWYDEVFGPVAVVAPFIDEADAIAKANDCPFGLAASIWTNEVGRAFRVSEQLDIGIIWVNDHHRIDPASPWGGTKDSGIGSENGIEAYRGYTRQRSVIFNTSDEKFDWFGSKDDLRYS